MFTLRSTSSPMLLLSRADGERMRMSDLAIPFDVVVAGVRRRLGAALPSRFRRYREWSTPGRCECRAVSPIGIGLRGGGT